MLTNRGWLMLLVVLYVLSPLMVKTRAEETQPEKVDIQLALRARMPDGKVEKIEGSVYYRSLALDNQVEGVYYVPIRWTKMDELRLPPGKYEFRYRPSFEPDEKYYYKGRKRIEIEESKTYTVNVKAIERPLAKVRVIDTGTGEAPPEKRIAVDRFIEWDPSSPYAGGIALNGKTDVTMRVVPGVKYQFVCDRDWDNEGLKSKQVVLSNYVDEPFVWKMPYSDGCIRLRFQRENEDGKVVPFKKYEHVRIVHSGIKAASPLMEEDGTTLVGVGGDPTKKNHLRPGKKYTIKPERGGRDLKGYSLASDPTFRAPEKIDGVKTITWMVEKRETVPVTLKVRSAETGETLYPCRISVSEVGADRATFEGQIRKPHEVTLTPGTYEVTARAENHVGKSVKWEVSEDFTAPALELTSHPEIRCVAVDQNGDPVPAEFAVVYPDTSEGGRAQAEDGMADIRYDPGRHSTAVCLFTRQGGGEKQQGSRPLAWTHKVLDSKIRKQGKVTFRRPKVADVRVKYEWTGSLGEAAEGQPCKLFFLHEQELYPRGGGGFEEPPSESEIRLQPGTYEAFLLLLGDTREQMKMQSYAVGEFTVTGEPDQVVRLTIGEAPEARHLENTVEARITEAVGAIDDSSGGSPAVPAQSSETGEESSHTERPEKPDTGSKIDYWLVAAVVVSGICVLLLVVKKTRQDKQR